MIEAIREVPARLVVLVMIGTALILSGCATPEGDGFAIFLTDGDIPPGQMEALSHVDITEQPIVSTEDVITYNAQTHELELTASSFERISRLEVPVGGKSFVVCVDRSPVYWGAFWTPISSISFDGVTIWKPMNVEEPHMITLQLGYPSSSFHTGEDPRNDAEVMGALEQARKLISKLSVATIDELPRSAKGYELYSWSEDGQWHFTLVTGTNRSKTLEEITASEDIISEAGWVRVHVVGVEAVETVLGKLPQSEHVFWSAGLPQEQGPQSGAEITLPPDQAIAIVEEYAERSGVDLQVLTP
jgi:hypothetical protein